MGPIQRLALVVALVLAAALPRLWRWQREEARRKMHLEELMMLNASGLKKQRQRFQRVLSGGEAAQEVSADY